MKIVINACFGGYGVSEDFLKYYNIPYTKLYDFCSPQSTEYISRTDKRLIEYIEKFGSKKASNRCAELVVEEIPNGKLYRIDAYDGRETIVYPEDEEWLVANDEDNA